LISEIKKAVYDLLQFKRAGVELTSAFTRMKHNSVLCPLIQRKLEAILGSFEKYRQITYDVQGPRDHGVDVFVRQVVDDNAYSICFQIKSNDDLRKNDWLKTMKSAWFDAQKAYVNMQDYYILVCCDSKEHKDKIRLIESEFSKPPIVHVIEPEYILSFIRLGLTQIDAAIKSKFGSDDIVFKKALDIARHLTPTQCSLIFYLMLANINGQRLGVSSEELLGSFLILDVYRRTEDYADEWFFEDESGEVDDDTLEDGLYELKPRGLSIKERILLDLETLEGSYIFQDSEGRYDIEFKENHSIVALMLDGKARYEYEDDDLLFYMMDLLGPHKGYEPKGDETQQNQCA